MGVYALYVCVCINQIVHNIINMLHCVIVSLGGCVVFDYTGMFPVGDTSSGTLIAVCVCVCVCVSQSVRRHIAILRQE